MQFDHVYLLEAYIFHCTLYDLNDSHYNVDVFLTVHHSIDFFKLPT